MLEWYFFLKKYNDFQKRAVPSKKNNKPNIYIYYHFIEVVAISYFRSSNKELEDVAVGSAGRALILVWPSRNTSFRCKKKY